MKHTKGSRITTAVIITLIVILAALILVPRIIPKRAAAPPAAAAPGGGGRPTGGAPGSGGASGGGRPAGGGSRTATAVRTAAVSRGNIEKYLVINGDVILRTQVSIFPSVSGKLTERRLIPGDTVFRGQTVAMVDPSRPGEVYSQSPVVSTISGTVIQAPVNPGDTVSPQTAIYVVGDPGSLAVETFVPERYATIVHRGLEAQAAFEAMRGEIFPAVVDEVSPILESASRTLRIRLRFTGAESRIKPGMFATVSLVTESGTDIPVIPREAVINTYGSWIVFVVNGEGLAERREITLGLENEALVEVASGLELGESVVVAGQNFLTEGDPVRVLNEE
ncbi:MAG: efflux RND transporter periplasmic adaptor subunit [Spirochaetaceae bacterium]|jgi:multidrug efflux pump subunit AcrA (membrane-fusion protein)|nr:efflux RND transporter periplasmic adaptor subunit [Spirochaetaceae bacterium]